MRKYRSWTHLSEDGLLLKIEMVLKLSIKLFAAAEGCLIQRLFMAGKKFLVAMPFLLKRQHNYR